MIKNNRKKLINVKTNFRILDIGLLIKDYAKKLFIYSKYSIGFWLF